MDLQIHLVLRGIFYEFLEVNIDMRKRLRFGTDHVYCSLLTPSLFRNVKSNKTILICWVG